MDRLARRYGAYKVETVADCVSVDGLCGSVAISASPAHDVFQCTYMFSIPDWSDVRATDSQYVAVAGLPEPRADHATVIVQFANSCLTSFERVMRQMEVRIGKGTIARSASLA